MELVHKDEGRWREGRGGVNERKRELRLAVPAPVRHEEGMRPGLAYRRRWTDTRTGKRACELEACALICNRGQHLIGNRTAQSCFADTDVNALPI